MPLPALTTPVLHSVGLNRPQRLLPPGACDSHMHIFDARFAPSAHWPRTPPDAPVAAYRQLQVLRAIRAIPGLTSTPVAIVTGDYYLDEAQAGEISALGAELRYKPLWLEELVTLARELLNIPVRD